MATRPVPTINPAAYALDRYATEGVIGRRFWAYLIDLVVIAFWFLLVCFALVVLGPLTLGLTWFALAIGLPIAGLTFVIYNALTIGGPAQATVGMRAMGLRVVDPHTGAPVSMLAAAVHALLFYVAISTFLLWACDVLIGFARDDRRFARDLLTGMMVVRA
ncbi:RDD family protein [Microvirga thermotolerans]|uniref:RDD family protein n=1 Tax=Microvirga thermotolerans TaxID=2651334 RepID=A0A5P9JZB6_9HYPH|nr:RDD family protein [Microvirga thermotolerans]QFU16605.1 RDD family protein [Microvirga thermotolerans]